MGVYQNPSCNVVVAAGPEVAQKPSCRKGMVVIIPYLIGGVTSSLHGMGEKDSGASLSIDRPGVCEFEKAL